MFAALAPPNAWGESEAAGEAQQLAASLAAKGFPVRHAGSFGFDFVATEAFFDTKTDRYVLRVASADLPPALFAQVADGVGSWWTQRWRSRAA